MTELKSGSILIIANQVKCYLYLELLPLPCRKHFPGKKACEQMVVVTTEQSYP